MPEQPLIYVVDDDEGVRNSLCRLFRLEGFMAAAAKDGLEALDALRDGLRPAVIILDLKMPNLGGGLFLSFLQHDERFAGIPVIVLSAYAHSYESPLPAREVMSKPFEPAALIEAVRRAC